LGWRIAARLPQTIEASGSTASRSVTGDTSFALPNSRTADTARVVWSKALTGTGAQTM